MSTPNPGAAWIPPAPAEIQSTKRETKFLSQGIMPPSNVFIDRDDILNIFTFSLIDGLTITVRIRELIPDNTVQTSEIKIRTNSSNFPFQTPIVLSEGFLLSLTILGDPSAPEWGNVFAAAQLIRGTIGTSNSTEILCRGVAGASHPLSFPYGGIKYPFEGPGNIRLIAGTTPGAGAEISEMVPAGARWRLQSFRALFTASAAVANRFITVTLSGSATEYFRQLDVTPITASLTGYVIFAPGIGLQTNANTTHFFQYPAGLIFTQGHSIKTITAGIQGADQYSGVQYLVEEWLG